MPSEGVRVWDDGAGAPPSPRALPFAPGAWLHRNLMAERVRWALWLPAFMGAGIGIYFWLTFEPPLWLGACALAAALAASWLALFVRRSTISCPSR